MIVLNQNTLVINLDTLGKDSAAIVYPCDLDPESSGVDESATGGGASAHLLHQLLLRVPRHHAHIAMTLLRGLLARTILLYFVRLCGQSAASYSASLLLL